MLDEKEIYADSEILFVLDYKVDELNNLLQDLDNTTVITNVVSDLDYDDVAQIHIPEVFTDVESRMQFAIATSLESDLIDMGIEVPITIRMTRMDSFFHSYVTVSQDLNKTESIRFFLESSASSDTIHKTLNLAVSLSRTGQKGSPVGALFVVGCENEVLKMSQPLNYNPFSGADVRVGDEVISASVGEFAKLDGAFIIADDGTIVSSNRYLKPNIGDADIPSGLGSRHMAASAITESTSAVAIVVSESDSKVRCFMDGGIVASFNPNNTSFLY